MSNGERYDWKTNRYLKINDKILIIHSLHNKIILQFFILSIVDVIENQNQMTICY